MDLSTYYKEEDIKGFINKLVSFGKIDNIINNISISKGNDQYEIFFFGNRLGSFKSDFDYTIEKNDSKIINSHKNISNNKNLKCSKKKVNKAKLFKISKKASSNIEYNN